MKTKLKHLIVYALMLVMWVSSVLPIHAATVAGNGVEISINTEKKEYQIGENITATVTLHNKNNKAIKDILLECILPDGYTSEGSTTFAVDKLDADGGNAILTWTFVPSEKLETSGSNVLQGSGNPVLLWGGIAVALLIAAAIIVLIVKRKGKGKKAVKSLSLILCVAMVLSGLPGEGLRLKAAEVKATTITAVETIQIAGEEASIEAKATFTISEGEEDAQIGTELPDTTPAPDEKPATIAGIVVEAESHNSTHKTEDYIKDAGEGVKYNAGDMAYSTWLINVEESGVYTIKTIGTGMKLSAAKPITGRVYVDDELKLEASMNTNEKFNPWDNPLETVLGGVSLSVGTHTIKLELTGGTYVMDKLVLEAGGTVSAAPTGSSSTTTGGTGSGGSGSSGGSGGGSSKPDPDEVGAIIIQAEDYTSTANTAAYEKSQGKAVKYINSDDESYAIWSVTIDEKGAYSFMTVGTGMRKSTSVPVTGKLYINDDLKHTADLNTNEKYNPWDNPLKSLLGNVNLDVGTYTIKLAVSGGEYIMDKMLVKRVGEFEDIEEATVITIEAESHTNSGNTEAYVKPQGEAVKYLIGDEAAFSVWSLTIEENGTYSFATIGNGMRRVSSIPITGKLYVNGTLKLTAYLNSNEKYNPWENPLESLLGNVELEAGTYTIKFEMTGGEYVMDKVLVTLTDEEAGDDQVDQKAQIKEAMDRAIGTTVTYKEITEYNPTNPKYDHIKAITYDGFEYKNKTTKVFAYVGFPDGASANDPVPAVVLVHGGGGHPYMEWVRLWNERGYAAIAMETTGYFPKEPNVGVDESDNSKFVYGLEGTDFEEEGYIAGPDRYYPTTYTDVENQWAYHGLTQIILASNILRQDERVDNDKIGITGVSWGGVTVSQLIGYDTRYSFAIPVYGSAYLGNEIRSFDNFDEAYPASLWLAEDNLDNAVNENMPIFWYSYNDDTNFGVPAYVASYLHTKESNAKNAFLMQGDWGHSHGAVFNTENSLIFADWVTYDKGGFITFDTQPEGRDISCTIDIPEDVTGDISAMLYYITDEMSYSKFDKFGKGTATYLDEYWQKDLTCLTVIRDTANPTKATVSGVVPRNTRGYYIQLFYQIENLDTSVSDNSSSSIYVALDSAIADTDAVITVKAKDYTDSANVQAYKEEYVQYITSSGEGHTSWNINVADTGIYTVTVTGNGTLGTSDAVKGKLYIDGDLKLAKAVMNTDGKWNVITNPLETELGGVSLTSGPHTIKFVAEGGEAYIMDKLVLVSGGTVGPEVDDDDQGGAGEGGNEGGGSNPGGAGGEETGTITIEAESYDTDTAVNITAYANKSGYEGLAAAHYAENGETIASTVWSNITIATAGNYTIKTVGTGNVNAGKTGSVTINGVTRTANLVTNGGWNPWANALETEIGVVNLEAGTYSMKLEVSGGNYVCDKILLVPGGTLEPDDGSGGEGTGSGNEGSGGSGTGSEGSGNAGTGSEGTGSGNTGAGDESNAEDSPIIIEAESYIANENVDLKKWDGYAGIAVQYADDASGKTYSTTWKVNVEKDGMYSFAAFGNGTILDGQTAIAGKLYVGDELKLTKDLTTGNAWNVFAEGQCLETALGFVELTAGEYSIKFETVGGTYVMDKLVITQANTITIEAENNTAKVDAVDYTKPEYPDQAAVQYQFDLADTGLPYTTHAFTVDIPGIYTFKTIGTGMVTPQSQYSSIIGKMYIGDELKLTKDLQTNEKYNVFDSNNRLESVLGATWLNAGTYTGKFEIEGGYYVLDKLLLVPGGTIEEDDSGTGGEGSGSGNEGGGSSGNEGSGSNPGDAGNEEAETITIEAESYDTDTAVNITSYANKTGYEGLAAAHYAENGEASASTVWSNITIATAGNYTIKTIGTGNANEDKTGTVTIDGVTRTANLVTNGGWNPWANPLETEIGVVSLEAGTYSIKLEVSGGNYVCDKLLLVPGGTIESN